ncbi:MAG: hypothetical protein ACRD0P_15160 [Stackebrandtia sp.]
MLGKRSARLVPAVLALGLAVGLAACGDKDSPKDDSHDKPVDKGIKDFDFGNATVRNRDGEDLEFKDGHHTVEGYEGKKDDEGRTVGWNIVEGPEFADIDGDNDLDAALVYEWVPAGGQSVFTAYVWTWDKDKATQVHHPIEGGNYGKVSGLKPKKDGFEVTTVSRPYNAPAYELDGEEETFTIGLKDGYPVQTEPVFGAVDRCVRHDEDPPGARGDGALPRVAPNEDAPAIGEKKDFEAIHTVASDFHTEDWVLVRAERTDGSVSCGWVKAEETGQG